VGFRRKPLATCGKDITYEWVNADGCASDRQAFTDRGDAQFGHRCGRHVLVLDISGTFGGDWGEAGGALLCGECFKRVCSSRSQADNIIVVNVSDNLSCRICCYYALKGSLELEGEQEGGERVPCFTPLV
jgi:hypothetical protein